MFLRKPIVGVTPLWDEEKQSVWMLPEYMDAIRDLAPGLLPVAFSPDGLVEGIVLPAKRFVWAVQWHPKYLFRKDRSSLKLFRRFIEESGRDN